MNRPEQAVQRAIAHYLTAQGYLFTAPDAGVNVKSVKTRSVLKQMGRRAGVADLVVWINGGTVCIEVKKPKTYRFSEKTGKVVIESAEGRQSEEQKEFEKRINSLTGHYYFVATSVDDVVKFFREKGLTASAKKE